MRSENEFIFLLFGLLLGVFITSIVFVTIGTPDHVNPSDPSTTYITWQNAIYKKLPNAQVTLDGKGKFVKLVEQP